MQSLRSLSSSSHRCRAALRLLPRHGALSIHSTAAADELQNEVLVEGQGCSRTAILNRPSVLNALNTNMGIRLRKLYQEWENDPNIGFVMMKGSGRAFCAGGDVVGVCRAANAGKMEDCKDFFRNLYSFIYIVGTYLKPHVAIIDGIIMGGGAGVSIPGTFRVATDKTIFSTPEVLIGFHPDAGASFYLSHLAGHIGEYLGLTGERINGVDMLGVGLATHFSMSTKLDWVDERLAKLATDDASVIESSLAQYGDTVYPYKKSIVHKLESIDNCFSHETVEEIIDAMEAEASRSNEEWCISALNKLKQASPLSLKVSSKSIREGRHETMDECIVREYRMSLNGVSKRVSNDFSEGIRARLIEKDMAPKWDPPTLEHVSEDMVDCYFSPLGELGPELELTTESREAFV